MAGPVGELGAGMLQEGDDSIEGIAILYFTMPSRHYGIAAANGNGNANGKSLERFALAVGLVSSCCSWMRRCHKSQPTGQTQPKPWTTVSLNPPTTEVVGAVNNETDCLLFWELLNYKQKNKTKRRKTHTSNEVKWKVEWPA